MQKFSIIIPTHNRVTILERAIQSVCQQTYSNFELWIVDDGSTDHTENLVKNYLLKDARIHYLKNTASQGVAAARNLAIDQAQGEYIAFLDDDDEYLPNFLQEMAALIDHFQGNLDFSWCGVKLAFANNLTQNSVEKIWHSSSQEKTINFKFATEFAASHGWVIKRSVLIKLGKFDQNFKTHEDIDLLFKLLEAKAHYQALPKVLLIRHIHNQTSLSRNPNFLGREQDIERLINQHQDLLQAHTNLWLFYYDSWLALAYKSQQKTKARKILKMILQKQLFYPRAWEKFFRFELIKRPNPK